MKQDNSRMSIIVSFYMYNKMYLCVFLLIFGVCGSSCVEMNRNRNDYENHRVHNIPLSYTVIGSDYSEKHEDIWRPCNLNNYHCMGQFLAHNSHCKPVQEHSPDPINLPIEKFYSSVSGITITSLNAKVRGLRDARISEFYVNKDTGNLVIAITMPHYNLTAESFFTYQRTAKEPISLRDLNTFETDRITLTAIIPKVRNLRLNLAEVYADTPNTPPRYYIGPKATRSHDPAVVKGFRRFENNVVEIVREVFVVHSYYLMSTFIQHELCDFGLDSFRMNNGYISFHRL